MTGSKEDKNIIELLELVEMKSLLDRTNGLDTDPEWNW